MDNLQIFILLMFGAAMLVGLAQKLRISYPIALVLSGTAIGFIPGLHIGKFDPYLILLIVLPPILYYAAFSISFREFKRNWPEIFSLALGLVIVSTLVVGVIFKWLFPQFPWALAFAFGAIVSPPDAVAATSILKRFSIGSRLLTVLEGESLINDATALVLYRLAVTALLTGTFSLFEGSIEFIKIATGGVVLGLILGYLTQNFSRKYLEPVVGVVFSLTIPYATYIIADAAGASGVLAVVVNGLIGAQKLPTHHASLRRILGYAVWDIFIILLNCFVFILIGLQLHNLVTTMSIQQIMLYTGYSAIITLALIVSRMAWVYVRSLITRYRAFKSKHQPNCQQALQEATLIGWAGMRGIVSLTAALALPLMHLNGSPLEGRNEVIFMTFVVILMTLLIPEFTLATLIRHLKIGQKVKHEKENEVRNNLSEVAQNKISDLHINGEINEQDFHFLSSYFALQRRILEMSTTEGEFSHNLESARHHVIHTQRLHLVGMWEREEIDDRLLNHLEHELDLEETHKTRVELR